jgi:hypothetical protein
MLISYNGRLVEATVTTGNPLIPEPIPFDVWPVWAKALKHLSKPQDKGIGDVVARIIGDENSEAFKAWFEATFKKQCGCKGRQKRWNMIYPFRMKSCAE